MTVYSGLDGWMDGRTGGRNVYSSIDENRVLRQTLTDCLASLVSMMMMIFLF